MGGQAASSRAAASWVKRLANPQLLVYPLPSRQSLLSPQLCDMPSLREPGVSAHKSVFGSQLPCYRSVAVLYFDVVVT